MKEFVGIFHQIDTNLTPFFSDDYIKIYILKCIDKPFLTSIIDSEFKFGSELFKLLLDKKYYKVCSNMLKNGFIDNIEHLLPFITNYELYMNCVLYHNINLSISKNPGLLISAIQSGSLSIIEYLINHSSNTNCDISKGLYETCKSGRSDIFSLLSKKKYNLNTTFLYTAIQFNHLDIVRKLIGIGVNYVENNYHCLTLSAKYGNLEIFIWLFEYIQQRPPFKNPDLLIAINNSINEACLSNQLTFLLLVYTNKYNSDDNNEIIYSIDIPNKHIHIPNGTLDWLAKKQQSNIIHCLLLYNQITNQQFLSMFRCNSKFMITYLI